ncbi:Ig-like domain-containing protein [Agromyces lapidis]|uniref:Ig-like domain-containing protein n=1 Tax=Agromyces lapidis TaxID=279574 RepID=A0ABV5SSY3_9MICO|nr:Ig-like domain-containing protein [Agromyces lapidis]
MPRSPRSLALAVVTALAATLGAVMIVGSASPAAATHVPNPSVDCYYGTFDGWLGNNNVGATDDVYDRDELAVRFSPPPLYNTLPLGVYGSAVGVLENDWRYVGFTDEKEPVLNYSTRAVLWRGPDHAKSFTLHEDGTFDYVPQDGYFGADSFQYVYARDAVGAPCSNPATVSIPAVDQMRTQNDSYTAYTDTPLEVGKFVCGFTCGVLDNDVLGNRNSEVGFIASRFPVVFTAQAVGTFASKETAAGGTLTSVSANGSFIYTPPPGFTGTDYFAYRAWGETPTGLQPSLGPEPDHYAKVTIHVVDPPPPDVPAGSPDKIDVVEDGSVTVTSGELRANDANAAYVTYVSGALFQNQTPVRTAHGTLDVSWTPFIPGVPFNYYITQMTYTPDPDFTGIDHFTYYVANNVIDGPSNPVSAYFVVSEVADAPKPVNDTATTEEDTAITIDLAANDYDGDGDLVRSSLAKDPCNAHLCAPVGWDNYLHGEWAVIGDGVVKYTPEADYTGEAIFLYEVRDAGGRLGYARATVTVVADDAVDDVYDWHEDEQLVVPGATGVLANDDEPAASDAATLVSQPDHGTVLLGADGAFWYTPDADFAGDDAFEYSAGGDTGTVSIRVIGLNDAPAIMLRPFCDSSQPNVVCIGDLDDRDLIEGETAQLRGSISDPEFDAGTFTIDWGDGSTTTGIYPCDGDECPFAVEPTWNTGCIGDCPQFDGPLYFEFTHRYADDAAGDAAAFPVSMIVSDGAASVWKDTSARVANAPPSLAIGPHCDPGGVVLCVGNVSLLEGSPGDELRLSGKVTDPGADTGTVTIDWGDETEPTVIPTGCGIDDDTTCPTPPLEPDLRCLSPFTAPPVCGYFGATHEYASGGSYEITVTADDGDGGTDVETTSAEVAWVNAAPTAEDAVRELDEDGEIIIDLTELAGDAETSDADLGFVVMEGGEPVNGEFSRSGSQLKYIPDADYVGPDSITYEVSDQGAPSGCGVPGPDCDASGSATGTIDFDVRPVNDAPAFTGGDDQQQVADGVARSVPGWATGISAGPANESGQTLEFQVTPQDASLFAPDGQPAVSADGTLTYTPVAPGETDLEVVLADDGAAEAPNDATSEPVTFTITLTPPNLPPVISTVPMAATYSDAASFDVSALDPEDGRTGVTLAVDGLPAGLAFSSTGASGTISGVATAEPGEYPLTVTACDAEEACAEASASLTVVPEQAVVVIDAAKSVKAAKPTGAAPAFAVRAKITEAADRSWGDLSHVAPDDVRIVLESGGSIVATCVPALGTPKPARGAAGGSVDVSCGFAVGVPKGAYTLRATVSGWFAGTASQSFTVSK